MKRGVLVLVCFLFVKTAVHTQPVFYKEPYRPQFHFTPAINWMNDPNGLVYYKGEYHLFYQYNPMGIRWGHMSWGHAVSKDLLHWEHFPVAIPEVKDTMIFSGSCVVDYTNTSGFAREKGQVPLVAVYTGHIEGKSQSQHIAYSLDEGRTWSFYDHNPVLDLQKKDFRDPKVFWYAPGQKWVMAVMWPFEHQVQFYQSPDLKQWELMSVFGPAGDTSGIWECPDLFQVPVKDEPGKTKWVFMHSPAPYMQYFVGEFDGTKFINESTPGKIYRPDYGPDYYAAIVYNNLPAGHPPVSIGWANNWNYAQDIPTWPWRSTMSLPRTLAVKKINGEWILLQEPVAAVTSLREDHRHWENIKAGPAYTLPVQSQQCELSVRFTPGAQTRSGIRLASGEDHYFEIGYDDVKKEVYIDRAKSGDTSFHPAFPRQHYYHISPSHTKKIDLRIFFDKSIVEIFVNGGEAVLTAQLFPKEKNKGIVLFSENGKTVFDTIDWWKIKAVW